jgi:hypothetical protein
MKYKGRGLPRLQSPNVGSRPAKKHTGSVRNRSTAAHERILFCVQQLRDAKPVLQPAS